MTLYIYLSQCSIFETIQNFCTAGYFPDQQTMPLVRSILKQAGVFKCHVLHQYLESNTLEEYT